MQDELRGSWSEALRQLFHWILVAVFLAETVYVSRFIAQWRAEILDDPEGTTWGLQNKDAAKYFKYLITANIKLVEGIWTPLSIWLSKKENHRTEMDLKSAMILKLFSVKSVLFYYPFIRSIFIQPHVEGCPGGHLTGTSRQLLA